MNTTTLNFGNGRVTFFNSTPHAINLITGAEFIPAIRKHVGGHLLTIIPASGVLLSAKMETTPAVDLGSGITIATQRVVSCDPIPAEAQAADYIIVSALYASAYRQLHGQDGVKLLTIRDLVVESQDNPRPCGCLGFVEA